MEADAGGFALTPQAQKAAPSTIRTAAVASLRNPAGLREPRGDAMAGARVVTGAVVVPLPSCSSEMKKYLAMSRGHPKRSRAGSVSERASERNTANHACAASESQGPHRA